MTSSTSWATGVNGNWDDASKWTNGVPVDQALITASGTYTVTCSMNDSVHLLAIAKKVTLAINDELAVTGGTLPGGFAGTINVSLGGVLGLGVAAGIETFNNTGIINLQYNLGITGSVALDGKGKVTLSGEDAKIVPEGGAATLTNGNTISGTGIIGGPTYSLTIANAAKGVIDGIGGLIFENGGQSTNAGLIETTAGNLAFENTDVTQAGKGEIKAARPGTVIALDTATLSGGTISITKGASLESENTSDVIGELAKPLANAGTISTDGGGLFISNAVKNSGTGLLIASNQMLGFAGPVTGGKAEISGSGEIEFQGPASIAITFEPGSTGLLDILDGTDFKGTVAGLSTSPNAAIDLENIGYSDTPLVNYNSKTKVLTVTDPILNQTDKIKFVGTVGMLAESMANDGSVLIQDPPSSSTANNTHLIVQSIASFGTTRAVATSGGGDVRDHHQLERLLAAPSHG